MAARTFLTDHTYYLLPQYIDMLIVCAYVNKTPVSSSLTSGHQPFHLKLF